MDRVYLEVAEVEEIQRKVVEHSGGTVGVRDRGLLESAVFRPQTGYYADAVEEAAALYESLVQNHPFHDGNKRTAFVATNAFLRSNGLQIVAETDDVEQFLLTNLSHGTFRFPLIRDWLLSVVKPLK